MADNKSSLVQIAQAVLDEATQSVKVAISVDGSPVDATNPMPVVITTKLDYVNRVRLVYSVTNVTTFDWIELLASVGVVAVKEIEIFDSSGETLELGVGAAASEVSKAYVIPGGNGRIPVQIEAGTRLAIKAVSDTANSGEIVINLYG